MRVETHETGTHLVLEGPFLIDEISRLIAELQTARLAIEEREAAGIVVPELRILIPAWCRGAPKAEE